MKLKKYINLGFTLIEVIAVMAIMSLIATISIPKISKYIDKANKTKIIAAVSELNNFVISNEIDNKTEFNDISSVLSAYKDIDALKINLDNSGNFKSGKLKGNLTYNYGVVNAKISEPEEFSSEVIGPKGYK